MANLNKIGRKAQQWMNTAKKITKGKPVTSLRHRQSKNIPVKPIPVIGPLPLNTLSEEKNLNEITTPSSVNLNEITTPSSVNSNIITTPSSVNSNEISSIASNISSLTNNGEYQHPVGIPLNSPRSQRSEDIQWSYGTPNSQRSRQSKSRSHTLSSETSNPNKVDMPQSVNSTRSLTPTSLANSYYNSASSRVKETRRNNSPNELNNMFNLPEDKQKSKYTKKMYKHLGTFEHSLTHLPKKYYRKYYEKRKSIIINQLNAYKQKILRVYNKLPNTPENIKKIEVLTESIDTILELIERNFKRLALNDSPDTFNPFQTKDLRDLLQGIFSSLQRIHFI